MATKPLQPGDPKGLVGRHLFITATACSAQEASHRPCCSFSQGGPPHPANDNPYASRAARTEAGILGCDGCGREGHTAEQCYFKRYPNWNSQHATVKWKESAIAKEIRLLANRHLRSLPPDGVQWLSEDRLWVGGEKLKVWKASWRAPPTDPMTQSPPRATNPTKTEVR